MERGDRHQQFSVDPNTGHIIVVRPLDREMVSISSSLLNIRTASRHMIENTFAQVASYTLYVRANDGGSPESTSTVLVHIDVIDVNDNPPLFASSNYSCVVQVGENTKNRAKNTRRVFVLTFRCTGGQTTRLDNMSSECDGRGHSSERTSVLF